MRLKKLLTPLLVLATFLMPTIAGAQENMSLPIDPAVKMGTLPNGLTYIIRKNTEPQGRAHFYIAQKVGSILEDDNQQGLAHFLEHMAFNGTKNFPGKNLISFLERIGCRFGADLNAYTAFDETVYTVMDAPTDKGNEVIDSCILILHDWSSNIELLGSEIDEERGVIHEEWRISNNAGIRNFKKLLPVILPNNKYANRLPIGTMEVVDNFEHKAIRYFYHKWYRPDLQGIIIVGDLDPDYVEAKIKEYFADIPKRENPAERYFVPVADNATPIAAIATDKEATKTELTIMFKHDPMPREQRGTILGAAINYADFIVNTIFRERFREIVRKPNAPFMHASASRGEMLGFVKTKDAFEFMAIAKDGGWEEAFKALVKEIEEVNQYGFLQGEYDRAKTNVLKRYEDLYNEREKTTNSSYVEEYKDYFLNGGYIPGIEMEKMIVEQYAQSFTLADINTYVKELISSDGKNLVMYLTGPEKEGLTYPTAEEMIALYNKTVAEPIEARKEEVIATTLIDKPLKGGKIVSEKKNGQFGATELKLNNGITVYIKPTDFKDDEIRLSGITHGGNYLYTTPNDILHTHVLGDVANLSKVGKFNRTDLTKVLAGRSASVAASINDFTTSISGASTIKDFETMLQLVYLYQTSLNEDTESFEAYKEKQISYLKMIERNPMSSLQDSMLYLLYDNSLRNKSLKEADLNAVDYNKALKMVRERLGSANGFQYYIVGNVDIEAAKPLIAKYLGSIPKGKAVAKMDRKKEEDIRKGQMTIEYKKDFDTPTAVVVDHLQGAVKYDLKASIMGEILNNVLDQTLIASIRERESGTYSPYAGVSVDEFPEGSASVIVQFICDPLKAASLNEVVYVEFDKIVKEGVDQAAFDKSITSIKKRHAEYLRDNGYWLNQLRLYHFFGKNYADTFYATLNSITTKDITDMLNSIISSGNRLELILRSNQTEASKK